MGKVTLNKLENYLVSYGTILSHCIASLPDFEYALLNHKVYIPMLNMFIEIIPQIAKNKLFFSQNLKFSRFLFEIAFKLLTQSHRVQFSEMQCFVGEPDILPFDFKPKSFYWLSHKSTRNGVQNRDAWDSSVLLQDGIERMPLKVRFPDSILMNSS